MTGQLARLTGTKLLAQQVAGTASCPVGYPNGLSNGKSADPGAGLAVLGSLPGGWLATASALPDRPTHEPRRSPTGALRWPIGEAPDPTKWSKPLTAVATATTTYISAQRRTPTDRHVAPDQGKRR